MNLGIREQRELEAIQNKLSEFLPAQEARELAMQICELALDIDEDIKKLLEDPAVRTLYDYDGKFFTPRGKRGFQTALDGVHLLRSLREFIDTFFKGRSTHSAIRWLLEELNKHSWVAKRRRMNWEEYGTLDLIPKPTLDGIIEAHDARARTEPPSSPLSPEEQTFFKYFEEQLAGNTK